MIIFFTIITGLVTGSFLNVCIYRMPQSKSVIVPRSFCPHCKHMIPLYDNIPVLSFALLGGKCRFCKAKISLRYLVVELLTAAVFVSLVSVLGASVKTAIYMALSAAMIAATFIDFEHQIIPDEITYGGMGIGLILSVIFPQLHNTSSALCALKSSFLGLLIGGLLIYAIASIGTVLFRKKLKEIGEEEAMGGGDIKFLAMIGAFLGIKGVIFTFFLAPFFGTAVGLFMKLKYKSDIIPYGPYLSVSAFVFMLWGDRILGKLFGCL